MEEAYEIKHLEVVNYTPLDLNRFHYHQKHYKKNLIVTSLFVLSVLSAGILFIQQPTTQSYKAQAAYTAVTATPILAPVANSIEDERVTAPTLAEVIEKELEGTKGTYGFVVKNLKTAETYYLNEHRRFQPASLYKLWIMATVYDQVRQGTLKLDEVLTDSVSALNERFLIATEDAELREGTVTFTVAQALEEMITNSHNYASLLLTARIKISNVEKFLKEHSLKESYTGTPPQTTPYDIALFFEMLYHGDLNSPEHTQEMIALLGRQNLNNVLPKYIPRDIKIAHKTGQLDVFAHDAGIFYLETGDYVIAGLSESLSPHDAEDRIAHVSRAVFEYFAR